MNEADNDFPAFANALYCQPGMADRLLTLQDRYGADVNLLLLCCWYGLEHGRLSATLLPRARQLAKEWHTQIIGPLRDCRRRMKTTRPGAALISGCEDGYRALREQIKAAELAAEQQLERELQQLCEQDSDPSHTGRTRETLGANLQEYWQSSPDAAVQELFDALLDAAWNGRTP